MTDWNVIANMQIRSLKLGTILDLLGSLSVTMSRVNSIIDKHESKPQLGEIPMLSIHDILSIRERTEKSIDELVDAIFEAVEIDEVLVNQILRRYCVS